MNNDERIIADIISKNNLNSKIDYTYIGATIIKKTIYQDYTHILFCEDGLVDENNIPYVMEGIIFSNDYNNDRIIVFYDYNLNRHIIPVDGNNWTLIGNEIPKNVKEINYEKAKKISHRKTLELKKEIKDVSNNEIKKLEQFYKKNYKKGRLITASFFASLLWTILFFLIFIFSFLKMYEIFSSDFIVILSLAVGTLFWILGLILVFRVIVYIPVYRLRKLKYKTDFLVVKINEIFSNKGLCDNLVMGYICENKEFKELIHNVHYYDVPFLDNVNYFEIVTRYSNKENPNSNDYCLFISNSKKN